MILARKNLSGRHVQIDGILRERILREELISEIPGKSPEEEPKRRPKRPKRWGAHPLTEARSPELAACGWEEIGQRS